MKLKDKVTSAVVEIPNLNEVKVGRNRSCDVVIPDRDYRNGLIKEDKEEELNRLDSLAERVSREHLVLRGNKVYDNNTINGTYLNGEKYKGGEICDMKEGLELGLGSRDYIVKFTENENE